MAHIKIANTSLDRRIKISDYDRVLIKEARDTENLSYQKIANRFSISKKMAIFVCHPERLEAYNKSRSERVKPKYDKEKHKINMQSYRKYKKELLKPNQP